MSRPMQIFFVNSQALLELKNHSPFRGYTLSASNGPRLPVARAYRSDKSPSAADCCIQLHDDIRVRPCRYPNPVHMKTWYLF
jgi:hypothetical protein